MYCDEFQAVGPAGTCDHCEPMPDAPRDQRVPEPEGEPAPTIVYRIVHVPTGRVSVAVVVDPVEGVILRAPLDLEPARIDSLVRRKGAWIVQQLRSFEDLLPAPTPREFVSGESFWYLGGSYGSRSRSGWRPRRPWPWRAAACWCGCLPGARSGRRWGPGTVAGLPSTCRIACATVQAPRDRPAPAPDPRAQEALGLLRLRRPRPDQLARRAGRP